MIITRPQLPAALPELAPPPAAPALALENAAIAGLTWPAQSAKRATFDTLRLTIPDLTSANLRDSGWSDVTVEGGELGGLELTDSSWRRVEVAHARMSGLILAETQFKDVLVADSKLNMANFRFARLTNVEFRRCNLAEADFGAAHLTNVTFTDCDLTGASFAGAALKTTDLRTSHLENIVGLTGLRGATLSHEQLIGLAPELALALGIIIAKK